GAEGLRGPQGRDRTRGDHGVRRRPRGPLQTRSPGRSGGGDPEVGVGQDPPPRSGRTGTKSPGLTRNRYARKVSKTFLQGRFLELHLRQPTVQVVVVGLHVEVTVAREVEQDHLLLS